MSDEKPGSGVTHTVTIRIPPKNWDPQSWADFKEEVKQLATNYQGQVIEMTFEPPNT